MFRSACQTLFLAGVKGRRDEGGGRILVGDDTGGGAVVLRPVYFHCVAVWVSRGVTCIHIVYVVEQGHNPGLEIRKTRPCRA